jgi:hypothetical protein
VPQRPIKYRHFSHIRKQSTTRQSRTRPRRQINMMSSFFVSFCRSWNDQLRSASRNFREWHRTRISENAWRGVAIASARGVELIWPPHVLRLEFAKYPTILITLTCRNHRPITYHHCSRISKKSPTTRQSRTRLRRQINMMSSCFVYFCRSWNHLSSGLRTNDLYMS